MSTREPPDNVTQLPEMHDRHLSSLYKQAAGEEPGPELDARVLDAARQAAAETPKRSGGLGKRRVPMSVAAIRASSNPMAALWKRGSSAAMAFSAV